MYPNGPISHERHHYAFFLEIDKDLRAELDSDEEEDDDEDFSGNDDDTSTEKPSDDYNNLDNNDEDDDDDDDDKFFQPTSSKDLPTASQICANASYNQAKAKSGINAQNQFDESHQQVQPKDSVHTTKTDRRNCRPRR